MDRSSRHHSWVPIGIGAIVTVLVIYGGYRYYALHKKLTATIAAATQSSTEYQSQITELSAKLIVSDGDNMSLTDALHTAQNTILDYQTRVQKLTGDVGTLTKLTTIDPELLKKYSKVYFLNEHYIPTSLTDIDPAYISGAGRKLQIHSEVWPHLQDLFEDATEAGVALRATSAYRSFSTQTALKSAYKVTYGTTAANRFSAEQGYSEHQLGTTLDFTTAKTGTLTNAFDATPEFKWLTEHAYEYGFILSYPKKNTYYIYEPWHWRYVGIDLATSLHEDGKYLYDLDQREIDGYLISIFD